MNLQSLFKSNLTQNVCHHYCSFFFQCIIKFLPFVFCDASVLTEIKMRKQAEGLY